MTKVFIGGSRHVSRLDARFRERVDAIVGKNLPIVIGDANGADKAVQKYLSDNRYLNVEVFCSDGVCRNNTGGWTVRAVSANPRKKGAEFYSAKDRLMAEEATVGLMIWDGDSMGTLMNVARLLRLNKKAVLYMVPQGKFIEFRHSQDWDEFIRRCDLNLRRRIEQRETLEPSPSNTNPIQASLLHHNYRL